GTHDTQEVGGVQPPGDRAEQHDVRVHPSDGKQRAGDVVAGDDGDRLPGEDLGKIGPHARTLLQDRKSTRLNSSHVKISYAVFCPTPSTTLFPYTTLFRSSARTIRRKSVASSRPATGPSSTTSGFIRPTASSARATSSQVTTVIGCPAKISARSARTRARCSTTSTTSRCVQRARITGGRAITASAISPPHCLGPADGTTRTLGSRSSRRPESR